MAQSRKEPDAPVLDGPPRIAPPADMTDEMRALAAGPSGLAPESHTASEPVAIYAAMLHAPELLKSYRETGIHLLNKGSLPTRDRELAILRIAWLCQSPFEWGEHVQIGKDAGLTADEIANVRTGSTAANWNAHDRTLLQTVEELFETTRISDPTWQALAATYSKQQLIELVTLIGQYHGLAYLLNGLRIRLRDANPGLTAL